MRKFYRLLFLLVFFSIGSITLHAQQSVSIGTTTIDPDAVLFLLGDGTQGLIIPKTSDLPNMPKKAGMVVYNEDDGKVYSCDGTSWTALGGGVQGNTPSLLINGNQMSIFTGLNVNLAATTPTNVGQLFMWDGTKWTSTSVPANPISAGQVLTWTGTSWQPQTLPAGGTVTNVSGTAPITITNNTTTPVVSLASSGVTAATYGNTNVIPQLAIDAFGRVTSAANISIQNANATTTGVLSNTDWTTFNSKGNGTVTNVTGTAPITVTTGTTTPVIALANTAVTAGSYGSNVSVPVLTIDAQGRITSATNANIPTANTSTSGLLSNTDWNTFNNKGSGTVTNVSAGTGITVANNTTTPIVTLANTAVTAGSYGSATQVPQITVDAQGRITGVTLATVSAGTFGNLTTSTTGVNIVGGSGAVAGAGATVNIQNANATQPGLLTAADFTTFTNKLGTGTTAGGDLTGTYPNPTLATSGVTAASYGTSTSVPQLTVDAKGRITAASSVAIPTASGTTTGLLASADFTTFTNKLGTGTTAGGDLTGTYPNPTLATSGVAAASYGTSTSVPQLTVDAKGRITAASSVAIPTASGTTTGLLASADFTTFTNKLGTGTTAGGDLTGTYPNPTLATSGVTAASYGTSTSVPQLTVDAKGRITAASSVAIPTASGTTTGLLASADFTTFTNKLGTGTAAGGDLTGTYPNPTIQNQGTTGTNIITAINNGTATGTIPITRGGTGATTAAGALTALGGFANPMTTAGDLVYGGAGGTPTRLATGTGFLRGGATPLYSSVNLASTDVTGTLPVANGGTGAITAAGALTSLGAMSNVLNSGQIFVGNAGNTAAGVAMTGDATISNTGAVTLANSAATRTNLGLGSLATLSAISTTEITDGTITDIDINATGITTAGKVSGNAITSGTIGGSTALNTTGGITTTGTLNTGAATVSGLTIGTTAINWPANSPGSLTNNGTGTLSWTPSFTTANTIPKGNGTSLAASQIFDDGNNVGIGTITPDSKLEVVKNAAITQNIGVKGRVSGASNQNFGIYGDANGAGGGNFSVGVYGNGGGGNYAYGVYGSAAGASTENWSGYFTTGNFYIQGKLAVGTTPTFGIAGQVLTSDALGNISWSNGGSGWGLTGNTGTNPATNFIGTTDAQPLRFNTGVGGVERMRIDATGNVGIGTTSPSARLHIGNGTRVVASNDASAFLQSGNGIGSARDWKIYVPMPSGDLSFRDMGFDNLNNGSASDAMVIQMITGNVGINTTTPVSKLDVSGDVHLTQIAAPSTVTDKLYNVGGSLFWNGTNISSGGSGWGLTGNSTTATDFIGTTNAQDLVFKTVGNEVMRIYQNGKIGINATPVSAKLDVRNTTEAIGIHAEADFVGAGQNKGIQGDAKGSTSQNIGVVGVGHLGTGAGSIGVYGEPNGTGSQNAVGVYASANNFTTTTGKAYGLFATSFASASVNWAGYFDAGNVHIKNGLSVGAVDGTFGTNGQVLTSSGGGAMTWTTPGGSGWGLTGNASTAPATNFIGTTDPIDLRFRTNNVERVAITSTGNVGIGTTTPLTQLDVYGTASLANIDLTTLGGGTKLRSTVFSSGAEFGTVTNHTLSLFTNNSARVTIDQTGQVGFGTTTPSSILEISQLSPQVTLRTTGAGVSEEAYYRIVNNSGTSLGWMGDPGSGTYLEIGSPNQLRFNSNFADRFAIGTSGELFANNASTPGAPGQVLTSAGGGSPAVWANAGSGWGLTGNAGTVDGTNFIGTTDFIALNFRVGGMPSGKIDPVATQANTFLGYSSGSSNSGTFSTGFGFQTLQSNTGSNNTAMGSYAMITNTSGFANTAVGGGAMRFNTTGSANTAHGVNTLYKNTTGNNNTALGNGAMFENTAGFENTAVGTQAMYNNITGGGNTATGFYALIQNTASNNVAMGTRALESNTTGTSNTAVGYYAGYTTTFSNANTTGSNNTFIGYSSGPGIPTQLTNATAIGANALVNANNSLVLGGTGGDAVNVGIGTTTPTAKLDVVGGNINTDGEVNRTASGASNMVPIAYGFVNASGGMLSGTSNISASNGSAGIYSITVSGETINSTNYVAIVTPSNGGGAPVTVSVQANSPNLNVYLRDVTGGGSGNPTNFPFYIVIYKY